MRPLAYFFRHQGRRHLSGHARIGNQIRVCGTLCLTRVDRCSWWAGKNGQKDGTYHQNGSDESQ